MARYDSGFRVGDFVQVMTFTGGDDLVMGRVTKVDGMYIWLDDKPEMYNVAGATKMYNVITLEDQVKAGLPIIREVGNNVESLRAYADTLERLVYECATLSSVMLSGVEDGEKIYKAIHAKFDKPMEGQG